MTMLDMLVILILSTTGENNILGLMDHMFGTLERDRTLKIQHSGQHLLEASLVAASWQAKHQGSTEVSPMKCFSRMMGGLAQNCQRSNAKECQGSEQGCQQCSRVAPGTTIRREQLLALSLLYRFNGTCWPNLAITGRKWRTLHT